MPHILKGICSLLKNSLHVGRGAPPLQSPPQAVILKKLDIIFEMLQFIAAAQTAFDVDEYNSNLDKLDQAYIDLEERITKLGG